MIFHWYLFVMLVAVYLFSTAAHQYYPVMVAQGRETRYTWFPVLIMLAVLTYTAATRVDSFGDTYTYMSNFRRSSASLADIPAVVMGTGKDRGFTVLTILLKRLIGYRPELYFGIIACFCLFCVMGVYRKHSNNLFMTIFLFLASGDYVQWTHNGIRQFIAVSMIFAATDLLLKKKHIRYYAIILLAATFHASALIMIPMSFVVQGKSWNWKTLAFMLAIIMSIISVDELTGAITALMENTQYANEVNQFLKTDGTNFLRVLVFCIPPAMSLIFRQWLSRNDPLVNLSINMSIASMGTYIMSMYTSGIFIGRVPIYFSLYNYMLLPRIIQSAFDKASVKLVYLMVMGCYMIFYWYQMHVIWGF